MARQAHTITLRHKQFLQLWLKAFQDGELKIPCEDKKAATTMRFNLYFVAKQLRDGHWVHPELLEAVKNVQLSMIGTREIVLTRGDLLKVHSALAELQLPEIDGLTVSEQAPQSPQSPQSVLQQAIEEAEREEASRATPYYSRGR